MAERYCRKLYKYGNVTKMLQNAIEEKYSFFDLLL